MPEKSPAEALATPVQFLHGVGPRRAEVVARLGLRTARDVLFFFPRDYEDLSDRREIDQLEEGILQSVVGVVEEIDVRSSDAGRSVLGVLIRCESGYVRGIWFNQPSARERFSYGQRVIFSGKPKYHGLAWEMTHPQVETLAEDEPLPPGKLLPIYPLTEGLRQWEIRKIVRSVLDGYAALLEEVFPEDYLESHDLWPLSRALPEIHFPVSDETLAHARRRFVYQELFILQLALAVKRHQQRGGESAPLLPATAKLDARIRRLFPFELTAGQQQVIGEISGDMATGVPMNRLLQGDVGSGKTVVAVYAMLMCVAGGYQAALMAPTEILARQHALTMEKLLSASKVRHVLLTGGLSGGQRRDLLRQIADGEVDLVMGTQAIIQEDVRFARLGLVVIDEQHKFGVRQRAVLKGAGLRPHYLVMTATPIPRTMTMTLFGDLDVSTLRDSPPGRQKVHTYHAGEDKRERWWKFFRERLREGRQGYVVTPLVDESEEVAAASLEETYESLANGQLEAFRLGLIHGRMKAAEKDAVMDDFRSGRIQVLICTSVVEVGVDVPNATLMTIEDGHRFGLAQLHQLRGRISRGSFPGYCTVFADPPTDEAARRLAAFVGSTDGFELAETDFAIRGPGDLFGTKQHGLPPLRIADLLRDGEILGEARRDAAAITALDPGLSDPSNKRLRRMTLARYGKALELGDIG